MLVAVRRRRGRSVGRRSDPAAPPGRRRPPRRWSREALGPGLPGRDPDLPGTIGRLAVRRDQPRRRDLHRAARGRGQGRLRRRALPRGRPARCCCCAAPSRPTATCTPATRAGTSGSSTGTCTLGPTPATSSPRRTERGARGAPAPQGRSPRPAALALGDAVFLPEAVRIAKVTGTLGGPARPGAPSPRPPPTRCTCRWTSTRPSRARSSRATARRSRCRATGGGGTGRRGSAGSPRPRPEGRRAADATIPTYISLDDPAKARGLDRAPVGVDITTRGVASALSVPVTALVGRSGGGFAVEVVRAGGRRELVSVKLGLFNGGPAPEGRRRKPGHRRGLG